MIKKEKKSNFGKPYGKRRSLMSISDMENKAITMTISMFLCEALRIVKDVCDCGIFSDNLVQRSFTSFFFFVA